MKKWLDDFLTSAWAVIALVVILSLALIRPKFRRWLGGSLMSAVEGHR